jgi:hypothetical protein
MHSFTETQPSEPETCRSVTHRRGGQRSSTTHGHRLALATTTTFWPAASSPRTDAYRQEDLGCGRPLQLGSWSRDGDSNPGPAHYESSSPERCATRRLRRSLPSEGPGVICSEIDDAGRVGSGRVVEHVKQPTVWRVAVARGACASGHRRAERALRVQARKSEVVVTRLTDAATAPTTTTRSRSPEGRYVSPPLSVAFAPRSPEPTARGAEPRRQARTAPWRAEPLWIHVD